MQSQYTGLFPQCTIAAAAVHHFSGTHAPPARSACTILPGVFKLPYHLSKIKKAPFYGFWLGACLLTTEQGILINEKAQAIDENREPIPGLFVTGDCSGGFFVNNYPCLMAGIAMGRTMTFAIKAVKVAFGE